MVKQIPSVPVATCLLEAMGSCISSEPEVDFSGPGRMTSHYVMMHVCLKVVNYQVLTV